MPDLTAKDVCGVPGCDSTVRLRRGLCNRHYLRWRRHGDPLGGGPTVYPTTEEAFSARVERRGDCLVWTGATTAGGYGHICVDGRMAYAHRYAWERMYGAIPAGMVVDHVCWNPACVNVAHLRLATHPQNMQNRSGVRARRKSALPRGVTRAHQAVGYEARVKHDGVMHQATFQTVEEADAWAQSKRTEVFGEFAGRGSIHA